MKRTAPTITYEMAGEIYSVRVPKSAILLAAYMSAHGLPQEEATRILMRAQFAWLKKAFGPVQWERIEERLNDEEDDLDVKDLTAALEGIQGADAARPTTSSPASSDTSQATTSSEEKPSQGESMFTL